MAKIPPQNSHCHTVFIIEEIYVPLIFKVMVQVVYYVKICVGL